MNTQKLTLKLYAEPSTVPSSHRFLEVWHEWIKRQALGELLVDVVDYSHVHDGPKVLLVGHESDYALHFGEGRAGLHYQRKRVTNGAADPLRDGLRRLFHAATLLERDLAGLAFVPTEVAISILDRLALPNTDASFAALEPEVLELAKRTWGDAVALRRDAADRREPLSMRVVSSSPATLAEVSNRLSAS
jgi:hypothetical protein